MSHVCGRDLTNKENKRLEKTDKNGCSVNTFAADCKHLNSNKTDGQHKMKRLKTRKERGQMRGGGKEAKSHHHQRQISAGMPRCHNCCHSSCKALFPKMAAVQQEPSIITDSRLTGHQGLFNHEVKSVDIERLLSERGRHQKGGKKAQEENHTISHPSSASLCPSSFCSNDLVGANNGEDLQFEEKGEPVTNTHVELQDKGEKVSCESDATPRRRRQPNLSPGGHESTLSCPPSSLDVEMSKKVNSAIREKDKESPLTPTVDRDNVKMLHKKVKTHGTPVHVGGLSPLLLSSSPISDSFDAGHDPGCISQSVSAVAARLCDSLQFAHLRRWNLPAESREVLLKALRERHGVRLQENFLGEQRRLSFGSGPAKTVQDHNREPIRKYDDKLFPTGASAQCFHTGETTAFKVMGSTNLDGRSSPQPHQSLDWTGDWLASSVDASASLLEDVFRPRASPPFCMDFESSGTSAREHLFAASPTSRWGENMSASQRWDKETVFDSFENHFVDLTRAVRETSRGPRFSDGNARQRLAFQTQLPERRRAQHVHFPREHHPFQTPTYSFSPPFSAQIQHPNRSSHFQTFSRSTRSLVRPPLSFHHTDMMHYPPSHMLERDPAPPRSCLLSPEHWSFPPMKLY